MGYIQKAPEKGYLEHPGSACCTDDTFEIFVLSGWGLCCCLLPLFVNRQLPCPHTNSLHGLLLPPMHHRNLWCAKERSGGVKRVQVSRDKPGRKGKKPHTSCSQQPACMVPSHYLLCLCQRSLLQSVRCSVRLQDGGKLNLKIEFQFTSRAMCAPKGCLPFRNGATMRTIQIQNNQWSLEHCSVLCIVQFEALWSKMCPPPPLPNPYISETAFSQFQTVYTYPPPKGTKFWRTGPKVHQTQEKCQNPPC